MHVELNIQSDKPGPKTLKSKSQLKTKEPLANLRKKLPLKTKIKAPVPLITKQMAKNPPSLTLKQALLNPAITLHPKKAHKAIPLPRQLNPHRLAA